MIIKKYNHRSEKDRVIYLYDSIFIHVNETSNDPEIDKHIHCKYNTLIQKNFILEIRKNFFFLQ